MAAWKDLLSHKDYSPVESLSDEEILDLADLKMDAGQNERMGKLQAHGKATGLTPTEQFELLVLIHLYQMGMLRKSEGLAEAVVYGNHCLHEWNQQTGFIYLVFIEKGQEYEKTDFNHNSFDAGHK